MKGVRDRPQEAIQAEELYDAFISKLDTVYPELTHITRSAFQSNNNSASRENGVDKVNSSSIFQTKKRNRGQFSFMNAEAGSSNSNSNSNSISKKNNNEDSCNKNFSFSFSF